MGPSRGTATVPAARHERTWPGARQRLRPPAPCQARLTKARDLAPPATNPGQVKSVQSRHWHLLVTRTQVCTPVGDFHKPRPYCLRDTAKINDQTARVAQVTTTMRHDR